MGTPSWTTFVVDHLPELWLRTVQHLMLTGVSTGLAILIGVPLGILAFRTRWIRGPIIGTAGILQTIPSLAMLTLLLALLHKIGALPAIVALTLYALLPIVRNTLTSMQGVSSEVMEAARGIGMTRWQQLRIVRLPLALPVIIAGIRTAAVAAVGIATLSAFIGAGGLGQFINRGLALADTRLILLGAVPAALLALAVDLAIGAANWAIDPRRKHATRSASNIVVRASIVCLPLAVFAAGAVGHLVTRPDMTIGSKNFTEQLILGHMMALVIEDRTDLTVDRRFCLGGTMICHEALINGEIDLYAEYTGTGLTAVLHGETSADPDQVYKFVSGEYRRRYDVQWLSPFGINNTYAIAVRKKDALQYGWKTISDLKRMSTRLRAGFTAEFSERPDGYSGLRETYGFQFGEVRDIDAGLMYEAIAAGEVDIIAAFATDGRIAAYDLTLLVDDRDFFPPYYAAPVVRSQTFQTYPTLNEALNSLAGTLDDAKMRELNFEVDYEKRNPREVAREFLLSRGLCGGSPACGRHQMQGTTNVRRNPARQSPSAPNSQGARHQIR